MALEVYETNHTTEVLSKYFGKPKKGRRKEGALAIKNAGEETETTPRVCFFPGIRNQRWDNVTGNPIKSCWCAHESELDALHVTTLAKEAAGSVCTKLETAPYILRQNVAGEYAELDPTNCQYFTAAGDRILFGFEYPVMAFGITVSVTGDYTNVTYKYSGDAAGTYTSLSPTDGTSGLTATGIFNVGGLQKRDWYRTLENGRMMYYIEATTPDSFTAPTTATANIQEYVYQSDYSCFYGDMVAWTDDGIGGYGDVSGSGWRYENKGIIAFNSDVSVGATLTIKIAGQYKLPQPKTYNLVFTSPDQVSVDSGAGITVFADGLTQNTNVITGMVFIFNAFNTSDEVNVVISPGLKDWWFTSDSSGSPDYMNWENRDLTLSDIDSDQFEDFWYRIEPYSYNASIATENRYGVDIYARGL